MGRCRRLDSQPSPPRSRPREPCGERVGSGRRSGLQHHHHPSPPPPREHTHTHACKHSMWHALTHVHSQLCTHADAQRAAHTCAHTYVPTDAHTHSCVHTHAGVHTHMQMHTHTHVHAHVYGHSCAHSYAHHQHTHGSTHGSTHAVTCTHTCLHFQAVEVVFLLLLLACTQSKAAISAVPWGGTRAGLGGSSGCRGGPGCAGEVGPGRFPALSAPHTEPQVRAEPLPGKQLKITPLFLGLQNRRVTRLRGGGGCDTGWAPGTASLWVLGAARPAHPACRRWGCGWGN